MFLYCVSPELLSEARESELNEVEPSLLFCVSRRIDRAVQHSWQDLLYSISSVYSQTEQNSAHVHCKSGVRAAAL